MITKGNTSTGRGLAAYLRRDANDRVEVWDIKGAAINDLDAAIDDWREFSKGTACDRPLYHAQLNPDRALSREAWDKAIEIFEKEMGLEGYPRAVVMHEKNGREHVHLVYSRFNDLESMRAWSDSWNYLKHERASRAIEREFGMDKTPGVHVEREDGPRPNRTPSHKDMQQGERKGRDARAVTAEVSALYAQANGDGAAFLEGLEEAGYTLARGDRRDFVLVGKEGGVYSLPRMANARVGALRDMLRDVPLENLRSVKDAQAQRSDRRDTYADTRQTARTGLGTESTPPRLAVTPGQEKNPTYMKAQRELAVLYAVAKGDGHEFLAGLEEKGYTLAVGDRRNYVVIDREGSVHDLAQTTKAKTGFLREMLKDAPLPTRPWLESSKVQNVMRFTYDMLQSANAPEPMIIQAIDRLEKSIMSLWDKFENVVIQHSLSKQEFEQYLQAKDARAEQTDIPRKSTGEMFVEIFERQGFSFARYGKGNCLLVDGNGETHRFTFENNRPLTRALREMLRDTLSLDELPSLKEVRAQRREGGHMESALIMAPAKPPATEKTKEAEKTPRPRKAPSAGRPRGSGPHVQSGLKLPPGGLRVEGFAGGVTKTLTAAVDGVLDFFVGTPPPAKPSVAELLTNSNLRRRAMKEQARRDESLDAMRDAIAEGRNLNAEDLANLSREDLQNLKEKGDSHLVSLIEGRASRRQREHDSGGRERER